MPRVEPALTWPQIAQRPCGLPWTRPEQGIVHDTFLAKVTLKEEEYPQGFVLLVSQAFSDQKLKIFFLMSESDDDSLLIRRMITHDSSDTTIGTLMVLRHSYLLSSLRLQTVSYTITITRKRPPIMTIADWHYDHRNRVVFRIIDGLSVVVVESIGRSVAGRERSDSESYITESFELS